MTASDSDSREVGRDDSGQDNAIERAGASDTGDSGLECLDVAEVEQIGADEGTQHPCDKSDLRRLFGNQLNGAHGCDRGRRQSRQGDAHP
jgi:hypothetical protein